MKVRKNYPKIVSNILLKDDTKILLLKRSPDRNSYPNKWNVVSGKVER